MIRPWSWETAAEMAEQVYGTNVDWKAQFFVCIECADVIYKNKFNKIDFSICPLCGYEYYEDIDDRR